MMKNLATILLTLLPILLSAQNYYLSLWNTLEEKGYTMEEAELELGLDTGRLAWYIAKKRFPGEEESRKVESCLGLEVTTLSNGEFVFVDKGAMGCLYEGKYETSKGYHIEYAVIDCNFCREDWEQEMEILWSNPDFYSNEVKQIIKSRKIIKYEAYQAKL